ncbi:hypothetical protein SLEP1_g32901 [Rubroshorea leprosula]|uniref:BHLH domain-containing protein n=1 Tax=Rubroshorea leprosula TaxID=152421 RepID=A0AAV5KEV8_9ROSI|nr:hypothetical protein SLEP1_g32901 [Rubroshorea leprosula]
MASGLHSQERVPENLKKHLAFAARSIQWSYAIFWSISARKPGVLEWREGYYNGDIKTRKTIQAVELNADRLGLQRSEQLRELYESLSAGDSNPQARRPSAALSPEDLTDTEWYYLVCMSFVFDIGQGLPGRTLANGQPLWLCNAHNADSKVFSRSLLAKSASIQTVVSFPFLGGVIELGVTELVLEDLGLIKHVKTSFLDIPCHVIMNKSNIGVGSTANDNNIAHIALDTKFSPLVSCEQLEMASNSNSSDEFEPHQLEGVSLIVDRGMNYAPSQAQSWQFMEEDFSNCVHHSLNSSDCISQTFVDDGKVVVPPKSDREHENCLQAVQENNQTKLTSLDLQNNDLHYQNVLSSLFKASHQLILGPHFQNCNKESSFASWKKGVLVKSLKPRDRTPQKILKKILFEVPRMHDHELVESPVSNAVKDAAWRPEVDELGMNHLLLESRQRERINDQFIILKSLVPSISKADQVSILDDTIEYLQELEKKVEELESFRDLSESEARMKRKSQDSVERTSDNYGDNRISNGKKPSINKRKACTIDEVELEMDNVAMKHGSTDDIIVSVNNIDVVIKIKCPWKEGILFEMMDAVSHLHLDCHSVQSFTDEGILSITIKSKYKGSNVASEGMIKQALQRIAWKC